MQRQVIVISIAPNEEGNFDVVLADARNIHRVLSMSIGSFEGDAISRAINNRPVGSPMTHDSWASDLKAFGIRMSKVEVTHQFSGFYYAKVHFTVGESTVQRDYRPSDAIALALRMRACIFVEDSLLSNPEPPVRPDDLAGEVPVAQRVRADQLTVFSGLISQLNFDGI